MGVRVRSGRVADGAGEGQPCGPNGLNRRLRRWLAREWRWLGELVARAAARLGLDRYRKHFFAGQHALALVFHGLSGNACLLHSYESLAASPGVAALAGLAADPGAERLGVSYPNLMDANRGRPAAFLGAALPALVARAALGGAGRAALPADLRLLDSTFLRLTLRLSPWLPAPSSPKGAPGVRVQVLYAPAADAPEGALVTTKRLNDVLGMDALVLDDPARLAALSGCTLVFDLGYYSHARFARLLEAGVHFVSRLKADATLTVEAEVEVQHTFPDLGGGRIRVLREQRVTLGSPHNRAGAVLGGLRLVEAEVAPAPAAARKGARPLVYRVLTDRFDLSAREVVQTYLWRWRIELFFRWLKGHVHLLPPLGHSRNAVELTAYLALVVHLLVALAARAFDFPGRSPRLLARLVKLHDQLSPDDLGTAPQPVQLAFPGWQPPALAPPRPLYNVLQNTL